MLQILDPKISKALETAANKLGSPQGTFDVKDIRQELDNIRQVEAMNNARPDSKKESYMDIFTRVLAADLWIKVDLTENSLEKGLKTQFLIKLEAQDPFTRDKVITGKTIDKTSIGDDKFKLMNSAMSGAIDDFRPSVISYFTKRENDGMKGELIVSLSDELDINFNSKFSFKGKEYTLSQIVDAKLKKVSKEASGMGSAAERKYTVRIPLEYDNELTETKEKNNFENLGYQLLQSLDELGIQGEVQARGLGQVEVFINSKK